MPELRLEGVGARLYELSARVHRATVQSADAEHLESVRTILAGSAHPPSAAELSGVRVSRREGSVFLSWGDAATMAGSPSATPEEPMGSQ